MATFKAVSSKCGVGGILSYVTKEEKTEEKLLSGNNCNPETVKEEMQATKELWGKTGGRTYKHFVQSFHQDEKITPEQAHELAKEFVEKCKQFEGFEVLIATHKDKKHIHTHFVLNTVNYETGYKFQMHKNELQEMKDLSDQLCRERGLHICEKGKTFEGKEREETSTYTKETYQLLNKAEQGEVKSYVQDIALAVLDCRKQAVSREDFIQKMNERGYGVDWQDNHKYITFTDLSRQEKGEKQCKVRNSKLEKYYNMDFGKEGLEREFEINSRIKRVHEITGRARSVKKRTRRNLWESGKGNRRERQSSSRNRAVKLREREAQRREREAQRGKPETPQRVDEKIGEKQLISRKVTATDSQIKELYEEIIKRGIPLYNVTRTKNADEKGKRYHKFDLYKKDEDAVNAVIHEINRRIIARSKSDKAKTPEQKEPPKPQVKSKQFKLSDIVKEMHERKQDIDREKGGSTHFHFRSEDEKER